MTAARAKGRTLLICRNDSCDQFFFALDGGGVVLLETGGVEASRYKTKELPLIAVVEPRGLPALLESSASGDRHESLFDRILLSNCPPSRRGGNSLVVEILAGDARVGASAGSTGG